MIQVSVIVPCYNEEATIGLLLGAIAKQTFPQDKMEIIIADGMSNDQTRQRISDFHHSHKEMNILIVDNPLRAIPVGLNCAIKIARGEYVVRLDAHSIPNVDYIERIIIALENGLGENIGGRWQIKPGNAGLIARSIAVAAAHPLGVGDAFYRLDTSARYVDTVPFGAFRRDLITKIGPFDETLLTNEDYEFNMRIKLAGGRIWLDPAIQSVYIARPTISALATQYWRYGYWKAQMLKRYLKTIRWRQALPPLLATSVFTFFLLGFVYSWSWKLLALELAIYLGILLIAGSIQAIKSRSIGYIIGMPIAIATMHFTWGIALLWGTVFPPGRLTSTK